MSDNYSFPYTDYLQMSFQTEALQGFGNQPFSPIASSETAADLFIPKRSPQLLSVEELVHEQSIQSMSEQEPHTIPATIDYLSLKAEVEQYIQFSSPPCSSTSSLSSPSSSALNKTKEMGLLILETIRRLEETEKQQAIVRASMQAPFEIPGEYLTDNNFEPLPYSLSSLSVSSQSYCPPPQSLPPSSASPSTSSPSGSPEYRTDNNFGHLSYLSSSSSSGSSPASSSSPPSSSPSSASYISSSISGSPRASAFTPPPQTAHYTPSPPPSGTMNPTGMFVHSGTMHGPSSNTRQPAHNFAPQLASSYPMNMGYGYAPPTSRPYTQYQMGGNVQDYNYNYGENTNMNVGAYPTGYYPQDARTATANFGQHYLVPAPPPHTMHQPSYFIAPDTNEFQDYDNAQPQNPDHRLRSLRPQPSNMQSVAGHHAGPSSSSSAQYNYGGYNIPPQSQGPPLRQAVPRPDNRHHPYLKSSTEDRERHTQVQPPSPKRRGSHTQRQITNGSVLHHGETEPNNNCRFDRRNRGGSDSSSKEFFVEPNCPHSSQSAQNGPSQYTNAPQETQKAAPPRRHTRRQGYCVTWEDENMIVLPPSGDEVEHEHKSFKPKTGAVMRNEPAGGEFVTVSGRVIPDEEQQ